MAAWLWVTNLDPKNDWIELTSFSLGHSGGAGGTGKASMKDVHLSLDPGRFRMRFFSWLYKSDARTAYVFFDPQTEFEFAGSMAVAVSASGHSETMLLTINFENMMVTHSGAP